MRTEMVVWKCDRCGRETPGRGANIAPEGWKRVKFMTLSLALRDITDRPIGMDKDLCNSCGDQVRRLMEPINQPNVRAVPDEEDAPEEDPLELEKAHLYEAPILPNGDVRASS